jgi:hypothetical protein
LMKTRKKRTTPKMMVELNGAADVETIKGTRTTPHDVNLIQ